MGFYSNVELSKPFTWVKYKEGMCDNCMALCCRLPTELTLDELIRMEVLTEFHRDEPIKKVAKELKKQGIIKLFNLKREIFTLNQRSDNDCIFLDEETRRCTVYENRPDNCRDFPKEGGTCAYTKKDDARFQS